MEFKTKYNIGDKVMVMANVRIKQTCPFCQGKGSVKLDGTTLYCQTCDDGILTQRSNTRQLVEGVITRVHVDADVGNPCSLVKDTELRTREEYFVEIDSNLFYGKGFYTVDKIFPAMTQQQFALNNGTKPTLYVALQKSQNYPATMLGYQISQVVVVEDNEASYRWIYEEIDLNTDFVTYARYTGEDNIRRNYPWVFE